MPPRMDTPEAVFGYAGRMSNDPARMIVENMHALHQSLQSEITLLRRKLHMLEAMEHLRAAGRSPRKGMMPTFRSQFGEDFAIWELLDYAIDGFYIEVGAFDGKSLSATWALDAIGWNGVLIEPIPDRYKECVANRPHARVVHAALAAKGSSGTAEFEVVQGGPGGMFSRLPATSAMDPRVAQSNAKRTKVHVPLTTMDDILASHPTPVTRVDAAVIDVEGGEVALLQGFDLERWKPRLMIIEDTSMGQDKSLDHYFMGKPYFQAGFLGCNRIYARTDDLTLVRALRPTD